MDKVIQTIKNDFNEKNLTNYKNLTFFETPNWNCLKCKKNIDDNNDYKFYHENCSKKHLTIQNYKDKIITDYNGISKYI